MPSQIIVNTIPLLGERSGVGKYVYEIVSRLALDTQSFHLKYYYGYYSNILLPDIANTSYIDGYSTGYIASHLKNLLRKNAFTKRLAQKIISITTHLCSKEYDLYFEPNHILNPGIRAHCRVVTVHDFSCIHHPEWHPTERVRFFENDLLPSLQRAEHIITVSETIRQEALQFGINENKITVIHNGIDLNRYCPPLPTSVMRLQKNINLYNGFILFVGTLEPRKNLSNLLFAYEALPASIKSCFPLIIAGGKGWNNEEIREQILRMGDNVRVLGYIPEEDLPTLYGMATLLVYPSWYEGFGLPLVEAMACGCPVVASNAPALLEIGGGATLHVSPDDKEALCDTIRLVLEDESLRESLIQQGLERAKIFSWQISANNHAQLFKKLCVQ